MVDINVVNTIACASVYVGDKSDVMYFCNLPFSDHLNVLSNEKFPGTMVAALSNCDLRRMRGIQMIHKPYKQIEISAWMKPLHRRVPETLYNTQRNNNTKSVNNNTNNTNTTTRNTHKSMDKIGFGSETFACIEYISIHSKNVSFGSSMFQIYE